MLDVCMLQYSVCVWLQKQSDEAARWPPDGCAGCVCVHVCARVCVTLLFAITFVLLHTCIVSSVQIYEGKQNDM